MASQTNLQKPTVLTIDIGTSALKAVVYNAGGQALAWATHPCNYHVPQPGQAQANPADWWAALVSALHQLDTQGVALNAIEVIGVTGQMHTPVLLDAAGTPLPPTILWLDRRAGAETAELRERLGLPPSRLNSSYTLPKLLWLARHQPQVLAQTRSLLWPKDYLRYRLTGQMMTDVTEAGGAALYNEETQTWATDRLSLVGLEPSVLPLLRPAGSDAGPLLPQVASELGLSAKAKVIVGAGDVIALLGGAPPQEGRLVCSLGSSAMISSRLADDQPFEDPAHRLYIYPFLPYRLLNGVLSTSGAALTWGRQALYNNEQPLDSILEAAQAVAPGAEELLFLPYLAGERSPYWNDDLRGGFYGLTLAHSRPHMMRAVLEGVAFSINHLVDIGAELGVTVNEIALAGGGASTPGWPQIVADVCQRPVLLYAGQETVTRPLYAYCITALDNSISFDQALQSTFGTPQRLTPNTDLRARYQKIYHHYRALADFVAQLTNGD